LYTIKHLSKEFKLSRSTLLYYDDIGLLKPIQRTENNYRMYSEEDINRLRKICTLREAGITLDQIKEVLQADDKECDVLTNKLNMINSEIRNLRIQQKFITELLKAKNHTQAKMLMDKDSFKSILTSIGFDEKQLKEFHKQFEKNEPDSHQFFLEFLGMTEEDIKEIKQHG